MQFSSADPIGLFVCTANGSRFACPVAERQFGGEPDVYTPLGFGGFVGIGDSDVLQEAWREFTKERGYVAGYVGLNPLLAPPELLRDESARSHNSLFVLDLKQSPDILLSRMSRNARRNLKKSGADEGLLELDRELLTDWFVSQYRPAMRARKASSIYMLSDETLRALCQLENVHLGGLPSGSPTAVGLIGATRYGADALFLASTPEGRSRSMSIYWHWIRTFGATSTPWLNLGGGGSEEDSVAQFKRRLGAKRVPFVTLRQVYRPDAYAKLCRSAGVSPDEKGFFPAYRARHESS
jgi:hypothetical protein